MKIKTAEILCVGTELLIGDIVNTNAAFLSRRLAALGISQYHQSVVGDHPARMREAVELALSRCDLLIVSGGLGPTYDDLTKETVCEAMGATLELHEPSWERIRSYFASRQKPMSDSNRKQAMQPVGGVVFQNDHGTAPGSGIYNADRTKLAVLLPGPPRELEPMFTVYVEPLLQTMTDSCLISKNVNIVGMGESQVDALLSDLMKNALNPTVAPYCLEGEVRLRVTAKAASATEGAAMCDEMIETLYASPVGNYIYGIDTDLATALVQTLTAQGKKIAVAESCTGGGIGARITAVSGSSSVFDGGVISYANEVKERLLGVRSDTLAQYGAVSEQCAKEMAQGVRALMCADLAVAVTGLAGPGGATPTKPVGLVYVGLATKEKTIVQEFRFRGDRAHVRALTAVNALAMALEALR